MRCESGRARAVAPQPSTARRCTQALTEALRPMTCTALPWPAVACRCTASPRLADGLPCYSPMSSSGRHPRAQAALPAAAARRGDSRRVGAPHD
eukprot:7343388-Prymnesium_polylepis.1